MSGASQSVLEALSLGRSEARRRGARPPLRPRPRTADGSAASSPPGGATRPARGPVDTRRDYRRRCLRRQPASRHPGRQPARARAVLRAAAAPARPVNNARFVFLDPRAETFYRDWERVAGECVAILRWSVGRDPDDPAPDLVGELATHSEAFRTRWAAHDVRSPQHRCQALPPSRRRRAHPEQPQLDLAADHGLAIFTYAAEPGSRSEEALKLGSWSATLDPGGRVRPS